jgi:hypothetical protein
MTSTYEAQDNLRQFATRPSWYDHLPKIEAAMAEQDAVFALREEFGWEGDEGGWHGPDPLNPGEFIPEEDWTDKTGLSLPEDMTEDEKMILEAMEKFGQCAEPADGIHEVYTWLKQLAKARAWP